MQTSCPNCSHRLVLDDAKVPDTPFMLRCPKCQTTIKLPGKASTPEPAPVPAPAPTPPKAPEPEPAAAPPAEAPPAPDASPPAPSPVATMPPASAHDLPGGEALISLVSPEHARALGMVFGALGYHAEYVDDRAEEKLLKFEQGDYKLVATTIDGFAEDRDVYMKVKRLPSDVRRRLFLVLIGDGYKTGDGTEAFAALADLVVHSNDIPNCDRVLAQTLSERRRVYQTFWDTEDRKAEGKL